MNEKEILERLLDVKKQSEIEDILNKLDIADSSGRPDGKKYMWRFLGESMSNAANVHTTSVTIAPIIERITNSFDAQIQLKELLDNKGKPLEKGKQPKSPRKSVEKWFNIPEGDTAIAGKLMKPAERTRLAEDIVSVELYNSDIPKYPTIVVKDSGIGQHPSNFKETLLSLGRSNKFTSPHLHGTFGHGGSSTYRFSKYTIILSRRASGTGEDNDDIGWTIVRKDESMNVWDYMNKRVEEIAQPPVYEYLCGSDGEIPRISGKYGRDFTRGTYVAHIEYNAKEWENLSRGLGFRLFRNYLFDPVLPFRLVDMREDTQEFARNMFGDRSILHEADYVKYNNVADMKWPNGGNLKVRYWLLHDDKNPANRPLKLHLERENSRNTIIVTLNGQRHGSLERNIISKKSRLPRVSESLLVQVVLDDLPREVKGKLFTSGRDKMVEEGDEIELLERKLIDCFTEDDKLSEWEERLGDIRIEEDESIKQVKTMLDRLITIGNEAGIGGSEEVEMPGGTGKKKEYIPQDPPTSLRMKVSSYPIEIRKNDKKVIHVEVNGPDDVFRRRKNRGNIAALLDEEPGIEVSVQTSKFKDGILPITIFTKRDAVEYDVKKIKLVFEADNLPNKLECEGSYIVTPEDTYVPVDPPTEFKIMRSSPVRLRIGKNNTIPISFNGPNDILYRTKEKAQFEVTFDYNYAKYVTRLGPYNGKIQIAIQVDENAKNDDKFDLYCKMFLSNGTVLSDRRECILVKEDPKEEQKKGDMTSVSRPNYDIKRIRRDNWGPLSWTEENVGKFEVKRDEEGKDKLILYINADNYNIDDERNRRKRLSMAEKTIQLLENKYVAYIAFHLYQQFESQKYEYLDDEETPKHDEDGKKFTEDQQEDERRRLSKTLILSLRSMKDLED